MRGGIFQTISPVSPLERYYSPWVRARQSLFEKLVPEFFQGEIGAAHELHQGALASADGFHFCGEAIHPLARNQQEPVLVAVQDISRRDRQSANLDGNAHAHDPEVGMACHRPAREVVEAQCADFGKVAHAAVGHESHGPDTGKYRGHDFAAVRGEFGVWADFLDGNHGRLGARVDGFKEVHEFAAIQCGADFFGQQQDKQKKGWVRALYSGLSNYSHSRPGFDAAHMWGGSNGPIYEKGAFRWTHRLWLQTLGTCFVLVKLVRRARPLTPRLPRLFAEAAVREIPPLDVAAGYLWINGTWFEG